MSIVLSPCLSTSQIRIFLSSLLTDLQQVNLSVLDLDSTVILNLSDLRIKEPRNKLLGCQCLKQLEWLSLHVLLKSCLVPLYSGANLKTSLLNV